MNANLLAMSVTELTQEYKKGEASPVEMAHSTLDQIKVHNETLNCVCLIDEEKSIEMAQVSEKRWLEGNPKSPIDGVPVTIKDLTLTKGWPTLRGSKTIDPAGPWNEDAPATARLREAGAVLICKTTTPEFGWKGITDNPLTGITRNAWDPERTPGGSSGGAASAAEHGGSACASQGDGGELLRRHSEADRPRRARHLGAGGRLVVRCGAPSARSRCAARLAS